MRGYKMGYEGQLKESVLRLESTRARRLEQEIPILHLSEKEDLIKKFHPDYRPGVKRELGVGVDEGILLPNELCDLLESRSLFDPDKVNLSDIERDVDVLVLGGGGGGATAALFARQHGADILLATKLRFGDSNTIMAEGGINACASPGDSPTRYYIDTMGGGAFTNIPELVRALAMDSPRIIKWLEDLGVPFDKEPDGSVPKASFRLGGGHSRPRAHSIGDYTGMAIMHVIRDEVYNQEIEVREFSPAVDLLIDDDGKCTGAVLMNLETRKPSVVRAKKVILATGGLGRLHLQKIPTTNHYGATADGIVIAYRAGAKLVFLDAVQFHPTGTAYPEQLLGLLVSEGLRGRGAQLVNKNGERFINELETRDTVAAGIIREVMERDQGIVTPTGMKGVWLDVPVIDTVKGQGTIKRFLKHLHHRFMQYGIDIESEPVLVYPAQHYQNGGCLSDDKGESTVENLYVVGEVAGGVHGRNRLGGNSLIDIFVFGRRAGIDAAEKSKGMDFGKIGIDHVRKYNQEILEKGVDRGLDSPLLLPDYRYEKALTQIHQ
jgi:succinate dehydrogenase / fumarate reductase flavoprotein subunit